MNERIKEIMKEAGYSSDSFGVGHWDMIESKRLVRLIVQECISVIYAQEKIPEGYHYAKGASILEHAIWQHFGLKKRLSESDIRELANFHYVEPSVLQAIHDDILIKLERI